MCGKQQNNILWTVNNERMCLIWARRRPVHGDDNIMTITITAKVRIGYTRRYIFEQWQYRNCYVFYVCNRRARVVNQNEQYFDKSIERKYLYPQRVKCIILLCVRALPLSIIISGVFNERGRRRYMGDGSPLWPFFFITILHFNKT